MSVLCLLRSGSQSSSNGPDGFIGNDNIVPVLLAEDIGICLNLRKDKVIGSSSLTCLQWLTAACNNLQSLVKSILGLGGNLSISLSLSTTFRMSHNSPLNTHVLQHISRCLSSKGTISLSPNILRSNGYISTKLLLHSLNIHLGRTYDNFRISGESGLVEHGHKVIDLADGSIALPVTADEEFTSLDLGGGCESAGGLLGRVGGKFGGGVGEHCSLV
mmetsp:Transcript_440/g.1006  ORF Transcript_440/g.1006 Transcript_440/m.1006 type:complete len:217 (+) Transcript_440:1341-1991(+)